MQDEFLSAPVHAQKMSLLITEDRVFIFLSIIHGPLCLTLVMSLVTLMTSTAV